MRRSICAAPVALAALLVLVLVAPPRPSGAQEASKLIKEIKVAPSSGALETLLSQLLVGSLAAPKSNSSRPAAAPVAAPSRANASLALVRARWRQMELALQESLATRAAQLRKQLAELQAKPEVRLSAGCQRSLADLLGGLADQKLAAVRMLDASARLPAGLLEGTLTELGNFDECLSSGQLSSELPAQYCSLLIKPALAARPRAHTICLASPSLNGPQAGQLARFLSQNSHQLLYVGLRLGVCLPVACSQPEVQQLLTSYLGKYDLLGQVKSCQSRAANQSSANQSSWWFSPSSLGGDLGLDSAQQCIAFVFLLLLLFVIAGSLVDSLAFSGSRKQTGNEKASGSSQLAASETGNEVLRCCLAGKYHARAGAGRGQPKRWLYQVYQAAGNESTTSATSLTSPFATPTLGAQQNPLLLLPSSKHLLCSSLGVRLTSPKQVPAGEQRESRLVVDDDINNNIDNDDEQETWIDQLERNERSGQSSLETAKPASDSASRKSLRLMVALLRCFSLRKSLTSISELKQASPVGKQSATNDDMQDIKVIHGLRTLTMLWIIFGHSIGLVSPEMLNNLFSLAHMSCNSRLLQAALNATLAVNTFFFISGLVTSISFARRCRQRPSSSGKLNEPSKSKKLDQSVFDDHSSIISCSDCSASATSKLECIRQRPRAAPRPSRSTTGASSSRLARPLSAGADANFRPLCWLLMRYIRLTPAYMATVGAAVLLPALGSGPFWAETAGSLSAACRKNWLFNLSYTNNFIETDKLCLIHSWYLSNDWQFFALAIILFGLYRKSARLAALVTVAIALGSTALTFTQTLINDFPPTIVTTSPAVAERWLYIHSLYYKPWPHLPSYLVGIALGPLILASSSGALSQPSVLWRRLGWTACILVGLSVLNSIYPWNMGLHVEPHLAALHAATFRTLWATSVGWLLYSLIMRPQCTLSKLLSWPGFQVTSRLTYCAYLVHPLLIYYHFGALRERMDSSVYGQAHRFLSTLMLSYLFGLVLSVSVESPSIAIQHLLARTIQPKTSASKSSSTTVSPLSEHRGIESAPVSGQEVAPDVSVLDQVRTARRKHSSTTTAHSSAASNSSWGANTSSNLTTDSDTREQYAGGAASDSFRLLVGSCSRQSLDRLAGGCTHWPSERAAQVESESSPAGANPGRHRSLDDTGVAIDSEFQRKLAQAISRGFRIRSRLASTGAPCPSALSSSQPVTGAGLQKAGAHQVRSAPSSEHMRTFGLGGVRSAAEPVSRARQIQSRSTRSQEEPNND